MVPEFPRNSCRKTTHILRLMTGANRLTKNWVVFGNSSKITKRIAHYVRLSPPREILYDRCGIYAAGKPDKSTFSTSFLSVVSSTLKLDSAEYTQKETLPMITIS